MTPVGGPVDVSERGPLRLGREGEGLVLRHSRSAQVELASEEKENRTSGTPYTLLARTGRTKCRCTNEAWGCVGRRWTLGTTLERRRLGLCWTPVDTRDRAGPGDAWLARRRRYSTARRDRAHNLKEAEGRAWTVRSNQRSSNALYCRVNERMNNEMRRDSCSSSLINFVLNLSKLFLMNCRMSSS